MTTATVEDKALTEEEITSLRYLLQHSEAKEWVRAVMLQEARTKQRLAEADERRAMPVVVTDTAPAPGSIYWKMQEQDLLKCIATLKDESVRTGNVDAVRTAEAVLNARRREAQVAALKRGASAMTPLQQ